MDAVHVAVAVIADAEGRILLAKRADAAHQGGLWEFPGGKVDVGETLTDALRRECREELGIEVREHRPLICVQHDYADRRVLLDVHWIKAYDGEPRGLEGQPLEWVQRTELDSYPMPAADRPIINAIRLPDRYLITPAVIDDRSVYFDRLQACIEHGVRLVQFRVPGSVDPRHKLAEETIKRCKASDTQLLINEDIALARSLGADGVHLKSAQLQSLEGRPEGLDWVAASCHDAVDLALLDRVQADFAVLSPVKPTQSHPGANVLGWDAFAVLARQSSVPVYALGGLGPVDLPQAWSAGAQGVAAITGLWNGVGA